MAATYAVFFLNVSNLDGSVITDLVKPLFSEEVIEQIDLRGMDTRGLMSAVHGSIQLTTRGVSGLLHARNAAQQFPKIPRKKRHKSC